MESKFKKNKNFKKKWCIGSFILLVLTFWLVWTNNNIKVTSLEIESENIPKSFNKFKIAHVSDLHSKEWKDKLIYSIKNEEPDIIVITGDLIDSSDLVFDTSLNFIRRAKKIAPIYYVSGNHEAWSKKYDILKRGLKEEGVIVLDDENIFLTKEGEEILLIGLKDPEFDKEDKFPLESINENNTIFKIKSLSKNYKGYKILLSHRPELFEDYVEGNIDLVLSGHAHGGQFRFPFIKGLIAPNQGLLPKYTSGLYSKEKTQMVVSRGLGNSIIKLRINNMPELIILELKNEK